ncbi:ArsR family transcriptional regulator [Microbispora rosea subsp. aerata]|nr:helix-turn-helix domain-containing protein [Microbispora rosea]GGO24988.1 ArsR family transcriptional regulator [Microbispora rosea subsp. aerata]GIH57973.1 ArsR family transcriptional regulator [Microbispora rosea subsp. aerata]GLJ81470.1 ArsR family transcriptional regulator [Microbispora rosea subsp. aerata]
MTSDDLESMSVLGDPVRRALYRFVAEQGRDVSRNEAAEATGVQRTLAAHHLDKLVEAGLLEAGFRRLTGRTGPGSGRPAKVYRRVRRERTVSLPPRDYRTLALALADAVELLGGEEKAEEAARRTGERLAASGAVSDAASGEGPGDLVETLRTRGYEPYEEGGRVRLRNCPFHVLAESHPVLVCSMNLALCRGATCRRSARRWHA